MMKRRITIDLPMPPSVNEIWRSNRGRVHKSAAYKAWLQEAGLVWLTQKKSQPKGALGAFKAILILNREQRGRKDLDNRWKASLDFCKAHSMITDDNLCEAQYARWGTPQEAPLGARLTLRDL